LSVEVEVNNLIVGDANINGNQPNHIIVTSSDHQHHEYNFEIVELSDPSIASKLHITQHANGH
jgi:hypothetical protein